MRLQIEDLGRKLQMCESAIEEERLDKSVHVPGGLGDAPGIVLAGRIEMGPEVGYKEGGKALHGSERSPQIMSNMVADPFEGMNGLLQVGGALFDALFERNCMSFEQLLSV